MSRKVLILNADYSAISVCNVPKAFLLVYLNKAELIEKDPKVQLRTVNSNFPLPSVIRLNKYVSIPYKGVVLSRHNIFKRDGNQCVYCGKRHELTLDHVMPKSRGGKTSWDNLVSACKKCNSFKGHQTPEEANLVLLKKPYKPSFLVFIRDLNGFLNDNWSAYLNSKS